MAFGPYIQLVYIVANIAYISALIALGWELGRQEHSAGGGMLRKLVNTLVGVAVLLLIVMSAFLGLAFPLIMFGISGHLMVLAFTIFPIGAVAFVTVGHWLGGRQA